MSNYTKTTDFEAKDSLPSGDSGKIIRGSEFETEFDNIATAIASKSDANNPTFTGTVTIDGLTVNGNTVLGNAATDTVTVTADIASNLLPSADDTYNLGAVGAEWNDLHVDGVAYIDTIAGFATTGNVTFGDNDKAIFGASSDLQIYHTGSPSSNSVIEDAGAGNLTLKSNGAGIHFRDGSDNLVFNVDLDSATTLYHNTSAKLTTTSTGIDVTGVITTDGMTTSADINFGDNDKAIFGAGSDLQIYHNGNNSFITDTGTGRLYVRASDSLLIQTATNEEMIKADADGAVTLYNNNIARLATTSTGIDVTGTVTADGLTVDGSSSGDITLTGASASNTGLFVRDPTATAYGAFFGYDDANTVVSIGGVTNGTKNTALVIGRDSNYVGIGTDSPNRELSIGDGTGSPNIRLLASTAGNSRIEFGDTDDGDVGEIQYLHSDNSMRFTTNGSEAMRIDSSGRVGINTVAPDRNLHVTGSVAFESTTSNGALLFLANDAVNRIYSRAGNQSTTALPIAFNQGSSEAMRITSGGHLLVGKSAGDSTNTVGFEAKDDGLAVATTDGAQSLILNRKTSDGTIAEFRKDNAAVGSIGTSSSVLYLGSGDTGVRFIPSFDSIEPYNTTTLANRDNALTLGRATNRFKDLYLSGGAYLGGSAAANKLDDYEEGTWSPEIVSASGAFTTVTYSVQHGTYTKIGDTVRLTCVIATSNVSVGTASGAITITGNPFAFNSASNAPVSGSIGTAVRFATDMPNLRVYGNNGQYSLALQKGATNATGNFQLVNVTDLTTGATAFRNYFSATIVFKTA